MKIFNWVHRKFHHKEDGYGGNVKKTETESQVLLEHVNLMDVLGGWREGILAIGTFGFDPSTDFDQKKDEKEEYDDEEDDDMKACDEEELKPVVFKAFDEMSLRADLRMAYELGFESDELEDGVGKKQRKERITLADLFIADSDVNNAKRDCGKVVPDSNMKFDVHVKKKGLSFAKKLIPCVGDDTRPIKKLRQLMRRMMKRKIHPALEEKFEKRDFQMKPTACGLLGDGQGANELVSLLQTKGDSNV